MRIPLTAQQLTALSRVLALGLLAFVWIQLAPHQLGGRSDYVVTSGISMEPRFHTGDLAIVREQSSYHVGEIVAYHSTMLHTTILHRIVKIQDGHYSFKGDNNGYVDPEQPDEGAADRRALAAPPGRRQPVPRGRLAARRRPARRARSAPLRGKRLHTAAAENAGAGAPRRRQI